MSIMNSLAVWSVFVILYQTIFSIVIAWSVLGCKMSPDQDELQEVTLMKFLYLYDPQACGRVYIYNLTDSQYGRNYKNVVWPLRNPIAASFRTKIQVWLALHLLWLLFAILNATQTERTLSFYATILPFTLIGVAMLILDIVHAVLFLIDAKYTATEHAIINYLAMYGEIRATIRQPPIPRKKDPHDTSWLAVMVAYLSLRGIVQWIFNFWLIKDNYFAGLYRQDSRCKGKQQRAPT